MNAAALYHDLLKRLKQTWSGLLDKPDETPETTLQTIWSYAGEQLPGRSLDKTLSPEKVKLLRELVEQRNSGVPLAYLTGRQTFMGIELVCSPGAMIPRKETEILGKVAIQAAHELAGVKGNFLALDVCTGSGNIALVIAVIEKTCQVYGTDLSQEAVDLAGLNAIKLGLEGRVRFVQGNLFGAFESDEYFNRFDLITCNPPYISSAQVDRMPEEIARHEPRLAFDGGPFGINILTRLVREAPRFLRPGGLLCFEVGLGQGKAMLNLLNKIGVYEEVISFLDEKGEIRAARAQFAGVRN